MWSNPFRVIKNETTAGRHLENAGPLGIRHWVRRVFRIFRGKRSDQY